MLSAQTDGEKYVNESIGLEASEKLLVLPRPFCTPIPHWLLLHEEYSGTYATHKEERETSGVPSAEIRNVLHSIVKLR